MRTIIAGSRNITDFRVLLDAMSGNEITARTTEVVSGTAPGVDTLGEMWATSTGTPIKRFPALWDLYGRAAGKQRNLQMAVYADALIAIWDGRSPGTRHMIETAERMKLKVFVYRTDLEHE